MHSRSRSHYLELPPEVLARILVSVASLLYILWLWWIGRFAQTDEVFFKSAGLSLITGSGFGAPELSGLMGLQPPVEEVFFVYTPLYSILFGGWVGLADFGRDQIILFDGIIHIFLMWITCEITLLLNRRYAVENGRFSGLVMALPALLVMPLAQVARPDELSMVLGMAGLWLLVRGMKYSKCELVAGMLLGLAASASIAGAIGIGLIGFFWLLGDRRMDWHLVRSVLVIGLAAGFSFLLVITPILLPYPDALQQYFSHAEKYAGTGNYLAGFSFAISYGKHRYLMILAILLLIPVFLHSRVKLDLKLLGAPAALVFFLALFTEKYTYLWFVTPWLLAMGMMGINRLLSRSVTRRLLVSLLPAALLSLSSMAWSAKDGLARLALVQEQQPENAERRLLDLIPAGSTVVTNEHWWFLGRKYNVLDSMFSNHESLSDIDYFVLSGNGSGQPGQAHFPANRRYQGYLQDSCLLIEDLLPRNSLELFGVRITNSAWGYGFALYRCDADEA